jgi:hypothetical protein
MIAIFVGSRAAALADGDQRGKMDKSESFSYVFERMLMAISPSYEDFEYCSHYLYLKYRIRNQLVCYLITLSLFVFEF